MWLSDMVDTMEWKGDGPHGVNLYKVMFAATKVKLRGHVMNGFAI